MGTSFWGNNPQNNDNIESFEINGNVENRQNQPQQDILFKQFGNNAGILKEGKDLYKKWNDPRYGTNLEIIQDGLKDLKNNAIGIAKGLSSSNINECSSFLPANIRKRIY